MDYFSLTTYVWFFQDLIKLGMTLKQNLLSWPLVKDTTKQRRTNLKASWQQGDISQSKWIIESETLASKTM